MALDPTIILAGQSPDIVNALSRANDAAQNRLNYDRQNAMNAMLKENGAGIMAGDQNALNALAGYDPQAALGIQAQRQDMAFSAEKMQMARDEGKRMAEEAMKANADKLSADQLAAEQQKIESALAGAASFYQKGDRAGYDAWLGQLGLDPQEYSFDQFPAHAAMFDGVLEAMKTFAPPAGPEWVAATPEQAAAYGATAGQINTKTGEFKRTPVDSGMVIETGPDGRTIVRQGPGVGVAGDGTTVGEVYNPNEIANVVGMIDEIANDPALSGVVGAYEGGGGNNVDDFSMTRRAYYGDAGLGVVAKIGQLQSNAWLSARAMLKGGGAITDYESRKAEMAVARLSRAQGEKEFRAALKDLRDAITEGAAKLQGTSAASGSGSQPPASSPPPAAGQSFEDVLGQY